MPFSEAVKAVVRKRAHFRCCLCRDSFFVDVHHIVPQAQGGSDDPDNAAPLCPTCHDAYGGNPEKRKSIREQRDFWYEICDKRYPSASDDFQAIRDALRTVATKEDIRALALRNAPIVLGTALPTSEYRYAFDREEFIHPLVVRELLGWLSDPAPTIVAMDLTSAHQSNQFVGKSSRSSYSGRTWVSWDGGREAYAYSHIATSPSGIQIVECRHHPGGSGTFGSVTFFSIEQDRALGPGGLPTPTHRTILKVLGSIPLGDRYVGKITYVGGVLTVGADEGRYKMIHETSITLPVE
jgi:hypothetical protein